MKKKLFLSLLVLFLAFFVAGVCVAEKGQKKGTAGTNKQSLETSTRGKERVGQRHQMKEERELGKNDDVDNDDKAIKKEQKEKKEAKDDKNKKDDDSGDDGEKREVSDDMKTSSPDDGSQEENRSRRWWDFFKKSE